MRAVVYEQFAGPLEVREVPDPEPPPHGIVLEVRASGLCRSDWHGWRGHDDDIATFPHVPGHEYAGVVAQVGADVTRVQVGDRVTAPFVNGCGTCPTCERGDLHICPDQTQAGFTHWGSFAQFVVVHHADANVVPLPDHLDFDGAASVGCRFATSYRAVVDQGRTKPGDWLAVHGCGGVGLSAVMIGAALGARVIAVDVRDGALRRARDLGAEVALNAGEVASVPDAIRDVTGGGARVSLDALGHPMTCRNSIDGLVRGGRHVQVGLLVGEAANTLLPLSRMIAHELEFLGSHGLPAPGYAAMWELMERTHLDVGRLIGDRITLDEAPAALAAMDHGSPDGVTVITSF